MLDEANVNSCEIRNDNAKLLPSARETMFGITRHSIGDKNMRVQELRNSRWDAVAGVKDSLDSLTLGLKNGPMKSTLSLSHMLANRSPIFAADLDHSQEINSTSDLLDEALNLLSPGNCY
jgi:hypothetical protein